MAEKPDPMEDNDVQLQIKKRARRRLIGAIFFFSVVAAVLPMIMDEAPKQSVQDVEIRIPGQDEKPFAPQLAPLPESKPLPEKAPVSAAPASVSEATIPAPVKPTARVLETTREAPEIKPAVKPVEKAEKPEKLVKPEKAAPKTPEKPATKAADKSPASEKSADKSEEAKRAAAILSGQAAHGKTADKGGDYLVLIGAFSDEANVNILRKKLGELKIKVITEVLNTPQGKKTRVRAGPFPSKDAAEQALAKMRRIGVSGVVAAR